MFDSFCNIPDQLADMAALAVLAIDLHIDLCIFHIARLCGRGNRAHGCAMVKAFSDTPRAALFLHLVLKIAARHVQTNRRPVDVLYCIGCRNIFSAFADSDYQFDFVVEVFMFLDIFTSSDISPSDNKLR